jgi:hypothetical protein
VFGATPVQDVDTALVLEVLEPIWTKKPETAGRVRGRVERILDWAKAREYREGTIPLAGAVIWTSCCRRSRKADE